MLDTTYRLARKGIFEIESSAIDPSIGLLEVLQATIYDYIRREFHYEPDWFRFHGYGQMATEDQRVKAQTAILRREENDAGFEWALKLKVRDQAMRRRNWLVHIGIRMKSESKATLYFAQFYYDHLAGSFSAMQPPVLPPASLFFMLMQNPRMTCMAGSIPLPAGAVALDDRMAENFLGCVRDPERTIPMLLISCPDLLNPTEVAKQLAGNAIVCWLDDPDILEIVNQGLDPDVYIKWDSVQVLLPFSQGTGFHPAFSISDISRLGSEQVMALLNQAYCENFRAEDRRAFVTVDGINLQRDRLATASLQERLASLAGEAARLREQNARLETEREQLQTQYDALVVKDHQAELVTYEALLNESMAQSDRLKKEITLVTQRLYECMGKDFVPQKSEEACISELQHSIFVCFARLGGRKQ